MCYFSTSYFKILHSAVPNPKHILVRLGSVENEKGGVIHKVKRIVQHEQYSGRTVDYDYSLLELEETIEFNGQAKPVGLPGIEERVIDNTVRF